MAELNGELLVIDDIRSIAPGAASDGWDGTTGTKADPTASASTLTSTPATPYSVIALLKAIVTGQTSGSGGGPATIASGADVTEGSTTDAPLTAAASASASTISAAMKGLFNLFFNGTAKIALPAGAATASGQAAQQGPVAPGTAAANSVLTGAVYNSSAPALTNAQQAALQLDASGNLKVNSATLPPGAAADGTDPSSPVVANQGAGIRGWLATIAALLRLGTANSANSASVVPATDLANLEPAGAKITAATMPSGGGGLTGWLSAIWYQLTQVLGVKAAAGALADGALTTLGSTTDAVQSGATSATGVSAMSILKGLFNPFQSGQARFNLVAAIVYQGSTGASLAANTAVGLNTMQCGTSAGSIYFSTINASVMNPPSAGQIKAQGSNDGTNWFDTGALVSCPASTVTTTSAKVFAQYARWVYVNGSTALSSAVSVMVSATATA